MKGICFTEPLFHKVVKGEKTQTRRMITPEPKIQNGWIVKPKSKYKVGEIVYLKEPYAETCDEFGSPLVAYRFDNTAFYLIRKDENGDYVQLNTIKKPVSTKWTINNFPACGEWKNKLFMPEWAARYFIEITGVRVERLQDISEEDCFKEGIEKNVFKGKVLNIPEYFNGYETFDAPIEAYAALIDKISGKGTWEKNPFVWVYDFRLIEK